MRACVWLCAATVLLRLAHQFGVGEDASLSKPVSVDLAELFKPAVLPVAHATELSLTANMNKADLVARRKAHRARHAPLPCPPPTGGDTEGVSAYKKHSAVHSDFVAPRCPIACARAGPWHVDGEPHGPPKPHAWREAAPLQWEQSTLVTLGPLEVKTFLLTLKA